MALHLIKLCVGIDSLDDLAAWRRSRRHEGEWKVHTRRTPKQLEALEGGSIYRVIRGAILCRQPILRIETLGEGRESRCEIVVADDVVPVAPRAKKAFQGWRYLQPDEAPPDLAGESAQAALPTALALKLRELGAW